MAGGALALAPALAAVALTVVVAVAVVAWPSLRDDDTDATADDDDEEAGWGLVVGRKEVWGSEERGRGVVLLAAWEGRTRSATAKPPAVTGCMTMPPCKNCLP